MFSSPFPNTFGFVVLAEHAERTAELQANKEPQASAVLNNSRQKEFLLGRDAASLALRQIGLVDVPHIARGDKAQPIWPQGVVGSITHSNHWAIAAVATTDRACTIGIDLEQLNRKPISQISKRICTASESAWLDTYSDTFTRTRMSISLFSAKESIYKALHPLCKCHIGFKDVELFWDDASQQFRATLLTSLSEDLKKHSTCDIGVLQNSDFVFTYIFVKSLPLLHHKH